MYSSDEIKERRILLKGLATSGNTPTEFIMLLLIDTSDLPIVDI